MMRRFWILLLIVACQVAAIVAPIRALWALLANPDRAFEIARAYDRLGNAAANGAANEFISTRANRARSEGRRWGCVLCRLLDRIDPDHCAKSKG